MVWIYSGPPGNYLSPAFKDPLRDGRNLRCEGDVHYGASFIAVRYGEKRDLWAMYGLKTDGTVAAAKIELRYGQQHDLIDRQAEFVGTNEFLVVYGPKKDRSMRFCFDGETWTRSPAAQASYPPDCHLAM